MQLTKISLRIVGNRLVPGAVEVVENDSWVCDLDVSLPGNVSDA
jgi:hypothetical protein